MSYPVSDTPKPDQVQIAYAAPGATLQGAPQVHTVLPFAAPKAWRERDADAVGVYGEVILFCQWVKRRAGSRKGARHG